MLGRDILQNGDLEDIIDDDYNNSDMNTHCNTPSSPGDPETGAERITQHAYQTFCGGRAVHQLPLRKGCQAVSGKTPDAAYTATETNTPTPTPTP